MMAFLAVIAVYRSMITVINALPLLVDPPLDSTQGLPVGPLLCCLRSGC